MSIQFDGLPGLDADVTAVVLTDLDGNPNRVIDDNASFNVRVDWSVTPPATAALIDGTWTVRAFAESMGPGSEVELGFVNVGGNGGPNYTGTIHVLANAINSDTPPNSGVYKLVVVITYKNALNVQTEMAGFAEGPLFMVRTP